MKKITLLLMMVLTGFGLQAQTDVYTVLPNNGGTSANNRAPQGACTAGRSVWLITAAEMADSGFDAGSVVTSLGFTLVGAQDIETTGTMTIYLQNVAASEVANNKSTNWATAITGMTTVSNGSVTIPDTTGSFDIPFAGGSPFTYTGGGLYVAFDYQNFAGPLATVPNVVICNTAIIGGLKGSGFPATQPATPPTAIAASNFRPETRLGKSVTCARPTDLGATNTTLTGADLLFNATAGGTIDLEYGEFGFEQGTGTVVNNVTSPYSLGGLTSGTVYDFYVRKDCGGGDQSVWSGPFAFNTVFEPVTPTYTESFEHFTLPFVGWEASPDDTADGWFINQGLAYDGDFTTASITPVSPATEDADATMYSRGINLVAGSQVTVDFFVRNFVSGPTVNEASYEVTAGLAKDAASQTIPVATETGIAPSADYAEFTYNFTAPTTDVYYIAIHNSTSNNLVAGTTQAILLDGFTVTQVLGTSQFLASNFSVFPNPAKNTVSISNTVNATVSTVEITDMNGRTVKNQVMNATNGQISVAELASGIYMMNITTDQGKLTKKIVKE